MMKRMGSAILRYLPLLLLISCEEVVSPSLISSEAVLVIDASISTEPADCYVRLSRTAPYNSPEPPAVVRGQRVEISDANGNSYLFMEESPGLYKGPNTFGTVAGRIYFMHVTVDGTSYRASSFVSEVPAIDSATYALVANDPARPDGYYVSYYHQDPAAKNFYRWKTYINGALSDGKQANIRNDANVNGKYLTLELPQTFNKGDTVEIVLQSISDKAFLYLQSLNGLLTPTAPSQAVPENPATNISGDGAVLGFFHASAAAHIRVIVEE